MRKARERGMPRQIMLGHLSSDNNTPRIAYETVKKSIEATGAKIGDEIALYVAQRYTASEELMD